MDNWIEKKLQDVVTFSGGSQPPKSTFSNTLKDGFIRLIQIRDYKSNNNIVYVQKSKAKKICTKEDIMIGRYGPPVFQILRGLEGAYNVALMKAIPNEKYITKDYLFKFLSSPSIQDYIIGLSQRAAGQSGVNKKALENYPILVPPISVQNKIVLLLDQLIDLIDQSIELLNINLNHSKSLINSALDNEFTKVEANYKKKALAEIVTVINGRAYKQTEMLNSGKYPILRVGNFFSNRGWYYSDMELDENKYCEKGDLLYAWSASFGPKIWDGEKSIYHYHIWKIVPSTEKLSKKFLYYLLERDTDKIKEEGGRGVGMIHITKGDIEKRMMVFPPLDIQEVVVSRIEKLYELHEQLTKELKLKLDNLKALKSSLLDQAFKGEL